MTRKLVRYGDQWALVLDQSLLDQLSIDAETPLELMTDGHALIVAPARTDEQREKFADALEDTNAKYGGMLRRLAE